MARDIPVFLVEGKGLPDTWEKSVLKTWYDGVPIPTEYDRKNDPPSKDCMMIMVVGHPMSEPRIHRAFPAGISDLEVYRREVVEGIHDHWIAPEEGKWTYTYHKRLFEYEENGSTVDQIDFIIRKLSETPYSRRAQAITWKPGLDPTTRDPPCLQRVFCRVLEDEDGQLFLNMNTHWRSRDAYKAAFMNMFAFTDLQRLIAEKISERISQDIGVGRYVDVSDSYHIYGSYYGEFEAFLKAVKTRTFGQRTWTTELAEPYFEEARKKLADEMG